MQIVRIGFAMNRMINTVAKAIVPKVAFAIVFWFCSFITL